MNRPMKSLSVVLALALPSVSLASSLGGQPDDLLRYGVGARGLAMGGAFGPVADDASASYYNPAGLALLSAYEVQLMHAPFFESTNLDYVGTALPLTPYLVLGASGVMLRSTGFEQRTADNVVVGNSGSISESAYMISAATRYDSIALGATVKILQQEVLGRRGQDLGMDLGVLAPITPWMKVSAGVQNINRPGIQLIDEKDNFPVRWNAGTSFRFPGDFFLLSVEYHGGSNGRLGLVSGGEVAIAKMLKLRAGIDEQVLPTAGFGVNYRQFTFDYALANHPLGVLHRFGVGVRFGSLFRIKVTPEYGEEVNGIVPENSNDQVVFRVQRPRFPVEWWKMTIFGEDGSTIVKMNRSGAPGATVTWDLRDAFGRPVREGKYPYEFQVKYRRGDVWTEAGTVKVLQSSINKEGPVRMQLQMKGTQQ
jgi:hypothetical protein